MLLAGTNLFALLIPWTLKLAIESLRSQAGRPPIQYAAVIIAAAVCQAVIRIFSRTTLLNAARRIEFLIREEMYRKLLSLDAPFFSTARTGDLLSRFSNDLTNVRMLAGFGLLNIINTLIVYCAVLYLMLQIDPFLTACAVVPFPLMVLIVKRISASMYHRSTRAQEELAHLSSRIEENVSAATLIRAYCREEAEVGLMDEAGKRYLESNMAMAKLRGLMIPVMSSTGAMGTLIVLFLGGRQVIEGTISLGDFVAFNSYLAMLIWPTIMFGWILNLVQRGAASMGRLNHILQAEPMVAEPHEPAELPEIKGAIEFREVDYLCGSPVLSGISLTVPAGTRLGIAGPIGSGKTTLAKLIPRLLPVGRGKLFIDSVDINDIPLSTLREAIGFVPQDPYLFSRSIRENIGYGNERASGPAIESAAEQAGLADEIRRFPAGFDTVVGERGMTLSGGQKQRTAIARALLRDPSILVLDDPLSAVDARTEEHILQSLSGYYGNRTVIMISHRLSALRHCDLIVYLEKGRIVEQGSHGELMSRGGRYADAWREQQLRRELEEY